MTLVNAIHHFLLTMLFSSNALVCSVKIFVTHFHLLTKLWQQVFFFLFFFDLQTQGLY
jgi:hypothetical protein